MNKKNRRPNEVSLGRETGARLSRERVSHAKPNRTETKKNGWVFYLHIVAALCFARHRRG